MHLSALLNVSRTLLMALGMANWRPHWRLRSERYVQNNSTIQDSYNLLKVIAMNNLHAEENVV